MTVSAGPDRNARIATLREAFAERFHAPCSVIARAPGRVNLIGEHTDYNDGFVLPIAIEQSTWAVAAAREDDTARVVSLSMHDEASWSLRDTLDPALPRWTSYIAGVAALLLARHARLTGFDLLIHSDVPAGGGLASSAALELSAALALAHLAGEPLDSTEMIDLCREAERTYAGVPCGLMDQTISLLGKADSALLLDCRKRKAEQIPLSLGDACWLVIDSGVRHDLSAGKYAERQADCREAVAYFRAIEPKVTALRDVTSGAVQRHSLQMKPLAAARARHVAGENERTLAAATALRKGDCAAMGELMRASHRSLRDDYQVSCEELDDLVRTLDGVDGVHGTRMTGAGFGGCAIALLRAASVTAVFDAVENRYNPRHAKHATVVRVRPGPGASIEFG